MHKNKSQSIENQLVKILCCGERGTIQNLVFIAFTGLKKTLEI
jgi:hypothetical protein